MHSARREPLDITILYVEDELITRATIHRMLKARYKTILLASDGKEGLELFLLHKPDIVITDTRMPVMDGLKMCRAIRETHPDVPIIFTTANEGSEFIEETRQLGITWNIIKPIMLKELFAALDSVITGMQSQQHHHQHD
ncbi:response regulator [bacterium]|nr:response regulator [bacterium]